MSKVMGDLQQDHRNVRGLLDLLAREIDAVGEASGGDFELMRDIMIYMTRYPDHAHHPKEDLMFERMRERGVSAETEGTIRTLLREHAALAEKGNALPGHADRRRRRIDGRARGTGRFGPRLHGFSHVSRPAGGRDGVHRGAAAARRLRLGGDC